MNTTTCAHCCKDFPDRHMMPLNQGGELCGDCMETLQDAAPDLLEALELMLVKDAAMSERFGNKWPLDLAPKNAVNAARAAITRATGKHQDTEDK